MNEKWFRDNELLYCALGGNCLGWCVKIKAAPCLCITVILFHTCCVCLQESFFCSKRSFSIGTVRQDFVWNSVLSQTQIFFLNPSDGLLLLARLRHKHNDSLCLWTRQISVFSTSRLYNSHAHTPAVDSQVLKDRTSPPPSYLHLGFSSVLLSEREKEWETLVPTFQL